MNVLLITWNFPPKIGGLENVIYNVWKGLSRVHTVYTVTAYSKEETEPLERVYRPPFPSLPFYLVYAFFKSGLILNKKKIDIIFSGSALTSFIAVILGKIFRKKTATHVFGLDVVYPALPYQAIIRAFMPYNDAVISISQPAKNELIKRNTAPEKIRVIHPGIDAGLFRKDFNQAALKEKYGFKDRLVLLTVCRLAKRKGIAEFINNSLPEVIRQIPEVSYILVGGNPKDSLAHKDNVMKQIKEIIKNKELGEYIRLLGNVSQENLLELYSLSDIFVLPVIPFKNDIEGFGVAFIEANAAGRPAVGTRTGGIPEAIEDGKSGIVVEAGNYEALSEAIINLLKDPDKRRQMAGYAQKRAIEEFNWDIIIKDYLSLFEKIICERDKGHG